MGVTYPSLVLETYLKNNPGAYPLRIKNIRFFGGPVGLDNNEKVSIKVKFKNKKGRIGFETTQFVNNPAEEKLSCTGENIGRVDTVFDSIDIDALIDQSKPIDTGKMENYYSAFNDFTIGPMLQTIESVYEYDNNIHICKVNLTGKRKKGNVSSLIFDPLLLSSSYMIIFPGAINSAAIDEIANNFFIPLTIENITVYRPMTDKAYIVNKLRVEKENFISFDAVILTGEGDVIAEIINAAVTLVKSPSQLKNISPASSDGIPQNVEDTKIAIIGLSGRYPGARNIAEFWDNLKEGKDCITEIPADRWDWRDYFEKKRNRPGKTYCKWGGFIEGVDEFDPLFFNILPREAEAIDPQERLFLECAYKTLEDAGYTRETIGRDHGTLGGNVGVFVGVMHEEYQLYGAQAQAQGMMVALTGNPSSIANRVSYVLNFHGPSLAVDTMCSSALTALHLACGSIKNGECEAAIAGGVNISIHPNKYLLLEHGNFTSSKGRCESFGKGGDGYVPGEGVGAVMLKPLSNAIKDGDHIYGVIRSSMINAGGKTSGYSVPNPAAQGAVIEMAFARASIDPRKISYIEAHGTGTSLGDPIEIDGLSRVFRKYTPDKQFCSIGSVKSNIGHCESAAGIAALTKVLLQLKHKQLVPSLHAKELNPNIDFEQSPFSVQRELTEWQGEYPRIAGISSFGAGGSNAHIIIEEYVDGNPDAHSGITPETPVVIVLSAKNGERLKEYAKELLFCIDREGYANNNLADIAYTLQVGREGLDERLGFITSKVDDLKEKLKAYVNDLTGIDHLYRGHIRENDDTLSFLKELDKEIGEAIGKWVKGNDYTKVLELWVKGFTFDWNRLYDDKKPKRISLPTYPFAREKYWIKKITDKKNIIRKEPQETVQEGNPFSM
jgi:polyketide synthase PksN